MRYVYKIKTRLPSLFFLAIFVASLFISTLSSAILARPVHALANPSDYSGLTLPDPGNSSQEYGVWLNRTAIFLVGAVVKPAGGTEPDTTFLGPGIPQKAKQDDIYGPNKDIIYKSEKNPSRTITVRFPSYSSGPATGIFTYGGGSKITVKLLRPENAKIDGYFYKDSTNNDKQTVFMPHYIGGIDGCGTGVTDGTNAAKYEAQGSFTDGDGNGDYGVDNPQNGHDKARVKKVKNVDKYNTTAVQYTSAKCDGVLGTGKLAQKCTMGIDNIDRGESSRTVYLVNTTFDSAKKSLGTVIDEFRQSKARIEKLTTYFNTSTNGKNAITTCKDKAGGGSWNSMSLAQIINMIATNPPASNPFLVCMYKELEDDADFIEAATYQVENEWNTDLLDERGGSSCSGTIPIIGDLICFLVRWMFDVINSIFTAVISFFAQPPDVFTSKVNTQFDDIIAGLRNVANIIFVLAFLMVVLQYLTNINVADAYFIKKFIPRLVVAVVLVQASGFIVKEMNSFFYDLGISIQSILFFGSGLTSGGTTSGVADGITTILAFGGGPAIVGFLLLIGLVMLIVLLITIIVLAIRYVAILLLAILAPLAFACFAIPQLEGLTKKWLKSYVQLLMMYPIIMMVLASSVIIGQTMNSGNIIMQLMGLIVQFIPYLILPFTFKFAGGMMGTIGAKVTSAAMRAPKKGYGMYKKGEGMYEKHTPGGRERAYSKKIKEQNKADAAMRPGTDRAINDMREARRRQGRGIGGKLANYRTFGAINPDDAVVDRQINQREEGVRRQELEEAKHRFDNSQHDVVSSTITGNRGFAMSGDKDTDEIYKAVARGETLTVSGADGRTRTIGGNAADQEMAMGQLAAFGRDSAIRELQADTTIDQAALQRSINSNASALVGKAPDIVKGSGPAFTGGMSAPALAAFSAGTVEQAFNNASTDATANSALMSALDSLVHGPDSKPLSDMSRGTAEAIHGRLTRLPAGAVDPSIIAALANKL